MMQVVEQRITATADAARNFAQYSNITIATGDVATLLPRVTAADVPLPYAPTLIDASLPNPARIIKAIKQTMYVNK